MAKASIEKSNDPNRLVPVRIFKDRGKYADDVTVGVNGKIFKIQRGKEVLVPYYVKAVLDASAEQDERTADMISQYEDESSEW